MIPDLALVASPGTARRGAAAGRVEDPGPVGPVDRATALQVLELITQLPVWREGKADWGARERAVGRILTWLEQFPGEGWQQRWLSSGADRDTRWLDQIVADDPRSNHGKRSAMVYAVAYLLLCRVVRPGYGFMAAYRPREFYKWVRLERRPELFARLEQVGAELGMEPPQTHRGITCVTRMVLHTGRDVDALGIEDMLELREWYVLSGHQTVDPGVHVAADLLAGVGVLPPETSTRQTSRLGQHSVEYLVDFHQIRCRPVRDVLVRYLAERAPGLDHSSLRNLSTMLAGRFWADIERHHPQVETLHLPREVAAAWKERLRTYTTTSGEVKVRRNYLNLLGHIRAFYLDIQEMGLQDPTWAPWAAPSPIQRGDLAGMAKARKATVAAMHQRIRERLPHLSLIAERAEAHNSTLAALLAAAAATPVGEAFAHGGSKYVRTNYKAYITSQIRQRPSTVLIEDTETGAQTDVTEAEDDAFWTWVVIATLRETGVRIEELMEITQLAIVSYRLPETGELVPLLQIVPSKSNEERLLPVD